MAEAAPQNDSAKAKPSADSPEKKESSGGDSGVADVAEKIILVIIGLALLEQAYTHLVHGTGQTGAFWSRFNIIRPLIDSTVFAYTVLATVASLFFFIGIVYALVRMIKVENDWYAKLYPTAVEAPPEKVKNSRWTLVVEHIQSGNPSDWRLAILESDIILGDLLDSLGYKGDTIGDKLKTAEHSPFKNLNAAWEAHRIRNAIAHEGQDFVLTDREARRVIGLYEAVFREFDYI